MADVQAILSNLKKVKGAGHGKWSALCPAHDDKKPSLSVGLGEDGKVLLHCHAGCDVKDIVAAIGMTEADLFTAAPARVGKPEIVAVYDYTDVSGKLLYQVVRRSDKSFLQRRPDGHGGWVWNIKGTPRVLYNLPYVASTPIEDWVFIVEGEKDVDALRALNIAATTNSGGAGKWHQVADDSVLHGRRVAIIPDNDDTGREHAQQVAIALHGKAKVVKIIKLPRMPEKGDVSDWLARFNEPNGATPYIRIRRYARKAKDFVQAGLALCESASTSAETDWSDPQPLPEELPPVKPFAPTLLPSTLRGWVVDIAERMQCPPDFPAVASMVALSGILGRKIVIRPKQKDNWKVYPNLWGMLIGRPSLMKSPPMKETLLPIRRMTAEALEHYEQEAAEHLANQELYSIKIKLTKDKITKALKADQDTEALQEELSKYLYPQPPKRKRYTVNDATVEALGEILSANPNGVILERDELMGFLKSLERAGQEGARAFFLETWTGDATFETDRIGRGNVRIDGVCLSVLGTIQPGPLGMYLNETLRGGTGDDGLMQRFQFAVWPDDPGPWKVVDRWPDAKARDTAYEVYRRFDDLPAAQLGELPDAFDSSNIPFLRFAPAAQERFYDWMTTRENHLRSGNEHPAVESHLTKYRKLIPALALVTHLAEGREGPVGMEALEAAIGWGDYLESHARRIYSCGIDPAVAHARALVQRIQQGDVADGFTVRDVYHGRHWSMLADAAQVQLAVDELVELSWLRIEEVPTSGRPTKRHRINPKAMAMTL
jgi:putative DNA primase/helicase